MITAGNVSVILYLDSEIHNMNISIKLGLILIKSLARKELIEFTNLDWGTTMPVFKTIMWNGNRICGLR